MTTDMLDYERLERCLAAVGPGSEFRYRCVYDPSSEPVRAVPADVRDPPRLLVVAGPDGAGKSSVIVASGLDAIEPRILNPDNYARGLEGIADLAVRYRVATDACRVLRESLLERRMSFGMEVTGTPDDMDAIRRAKDEGYRVELVFVIVRDPETVLLRAAERAAMGGRSAGRDAVLTSHRRSEAVLPELLELSDAAIVLDNGGEHPEIVSSTVTDIVRRFAGMP